VIFIYTDKQHKNKIILLFQVKGTFIDLSALEIALRMDLNISTDSTVVNTSNETTTESIVNNPSSEPERNLEEELSQQQCVLPIYDVDASYMISDGCFQVIPFIRMETSAKDDFICLYKDTYRNSSETADFIKHFENTYTPNEAIKWLYECPFIQRFLEIIFIYHSIESMLMCRFFINDIQNLLQNHMCNSTIEVYRYEIISNEQWSYLKKSKDQIIAVKYFFLANTDRSKASQSIAKQDSNNAKRVVFTVEANPKLAGVKPFAKIGPFSSINDENDVLFLIGSLFKLTDIVEESNDLINIKLTLCAADTTNTNQIACEQIKMKYMSSSDGIDLIVFGQFLSDLGKVLDKPVPFNHIEPIFQTCLNKLADDDLKRCRYYHGLGSIAFERNDLDKSLEWYQKSLDLNKQKQSNDHTYLTEIYSNLGKIYSFKQQLPEALDSYNELVQLYRNRLGDDCTKLIWCYINIALIHEKQTNFRDELSYYYRSLSIMNKHYQSIDEEQRTTLYSNIGIVYANLEEYHLALGYFRTALDKRLKLQSNMSPLLAKLYSNIGLVCQYLNDIQQAKDNYTKAKQIYEQLNGSDDPNVKSIQEILQNLTI